MFIGWKNIVKTSTLRKAIYRFSAIPIKIPMVFFTEINKPTHIWWINSWQRSQEYTMGKGRSLQQTENWIATCERLDLCLTPGTNVNSKWIKDLIVTTENHKTRSKHRQRAPCTGLGDDFSNLTPTAQKRKAKINKWDYIKLNGFYAGKKKSHQ